MPTEISPWIERLKEHRVAAGAVTALLVLAIALAWVAWRWGVAEDRMAMLEKQAAAGFLQPPSSNRTVRIDLRSPRVVTVGGGKFPERVDLLVNARTKQYARFRVSLLRDDGTLLVHADQMVRDSNFDLRLSFNTSMLSAGRYLVRVEGHARNGRLERFAERGAGHASMNRVSTPRSRASCYSGASALHRPTWSPCLRWASIASGKATLSVCAPPPLPWQTKTRSSSSRNPW